MRSSIPRAFNGAFNGIQKRAYSTPRHLLSISDLTPTEFTNLVRNAAVHKKAVKEGLAPLSLSTGLSNQTVAMTFSKRSTRTRVSTEAAVTIMGGHPMFLGKDDIQLGVSSFQDPLAETIAEMCCDR
jgi:ornithine carbamoyltransferase